MYTDRELDLIALSSFTGLTYAVRRALISEPAGSVDFEKQRGFLIKTLSCGVYNKLRADFYSPDYRAGLLRGLNESGIKCVTYVSAGYPEPLANIDTPPLVLYCRGDISLLQSRCFTVVGSRRSTPKALAECRRLSGRLAEKYTLVSGIAEGADTAALEGALQAGGRVISVLAGGLGYIYPACNAALYERVERHGLLVTEHPPGVQPKPYNFPVRNRILAGLSEGTLVVSAGTRSGALITADYAAEYGRDVYAFPYGIGEATGAGCNLLIKKGAYLTDNILDISPEFGLDLNTHGQNSVTEEEQAVLSAVRQLGEAFLPDVAARLGRLPHEVLPAITSLQIKGLLVSLGGNRYTAI